jgi:biopolymer transport protein ExbB
MEADRVGQVPWMDLLKDWLDIAVFGVLGLMSFLLVAYAIERLLFYWRVDVGSYRDRPSLDVALTRHVAIIASIASNAPYIGLLGTVLGILVAFHDLAQDAAMSASSVMLGLALALKATAAGLAVAIPATLVYNAMVRRVDVLTARWSSRQGAP